MRASARAMHRGASHFVLPLRCSYGNKRPFGTRSWHVDGLMAFGCAERRCGRQVSVAAAGWGGESPSKRWLKINPV